ncbi:hypothetical protein EN871_12800 [bacterium M00.F.Ca.ET.228.01.1.1]|uniref:hypothetical protein n=1 Tax=Paraburkholderia phenoliruptrix TaxID=252970 RepID=UPI00109216A4|nr:hypothetical protein [Paraburkholderia phenoliruptrix]MBW9128715.1 hypothetical protein [Paraburkholderia ginsengiterrae]TGP43907.1 hypothetical protein EN871_12800 [bacterium M00.F.Ca.ET.228.01.1.1]TGS01570.1 hypothetical protein EN834_12795 [bacterium M00.F.Ca.ET.191.01.1.1]TGU08824.1 hypothetical protein EN798_06735 [bacterium M00.F.Ca.ET.155.01.1.1]MBW0449047.1 hypothetical protein [Paraburkholderia phenoliruptrix]
MQFPTIRRLLSGLFPHFSQTQSQTPGTVRAGSDTSALDFDLVWHGDHWQNLLSSPMDARRYVIEDWSAPTANEWWSADRAASAH